MTEKVLGRLIVTLGLAVVAAGCIPADRQTLAPALREWAIDVGDPACDFRSAELMILQFYGSSEKEPACLAADVDGLAIDSFRVTGPSGKYRLMVLHDRRVAGNGRVAIYLNGGPRNMPMSFVRKEFLAGVPAALARQGYAVLLPEHLGSFGRSVYPASDLVPGAAEIGELASRAAAGGRRRVVLIAASADNVLGFEVAERIGIPLVLLSALVPSMRGLLDDPSGTDLSPDIRDYQRYIYRIVGDNGRELVRTRDYDQARAFAGRRFDMDLVTQVNAAPASVRRCLILVFGAADRRVKLATLDRSALKLPPDRIAIVPGMGHGPKTEAEGDAVAGIVDRFTDAAPCRPGRG